MKYSVVIKKNGMTISEIFDCTKAEAKKVAKAKAAENKDVQVFVTWFRSSDGQHGYLNSNGDHAITGTAWVLCSP
jgi:hypothetical protein